MKRDSNGNAKGFSFRSLFYSFKFRIAVTFSTLFLIVIAFTALIQAYGVPFTSYQGMIRTQKIEVKKNLETMADLGKRLFTTWMSERYGDLQVIIFNRTIRETFPRLRQNSGILKNTNVEFDTLRYTPDYIKVYDLISYATRAYKVYSSVSLADAKSGRILVSTNISLEGEDVSKREYFQKALNSTSTYVDKFQPEGSQEFYFVVAQALRSETDEVEAVVVMMLNGNFALEPIMIISRGIGEGGEAVIVNNKEEALATMFFSESKSNYTIVNLERPIKIGPSGKKAVAGGEGYEETIDYRNEPVFAAYKSLPLMRNAMWGLVVKMDKSVVFGRIWQMFIYMAVSDAALLFLFMFVIYIIAGRLTNSFTVLGEAAGEIGSGNLAARAVIRDKGEIGKLADEFNHMAESIQAATASLQDEIAQRKATEVKLIESERRHRTVITTTVDGFLMFDTSGKITDVNEACLKLYGYERNELLNMSVFKLDENLEPGVYGGRISLIREHGYERFETIHRRKDGSLIDVDMSVNYIGEGGGVYFSFIRDITERKSFIQKLEKTTTQLQKSNKELEQFAFVASHDLQEPLRTVSSYVQLLERRNKGKLGDEADTFIIYIVEAVKRMQLLINDLLAFSRVGRSRVEYRVENLNAIVREVLYALENQIQGASAEVKVGQLPATRCDGKLMFQLFQNLVSNAIKFHGINPPKVEIGGETRENDWLFYVKDNGIGIKKDYFDKIFLIFKRLHGREKYEGTGIGLALAKKIIEEHGGRIWVDSEEGVGSTFHFTIPFNSGR